MTGTIYLLHLDPPYKHARHYLGWVDHDLEARLAKHRRGQGARLLEVITAAGGRAVLVRTWAGDRTLERTMKNRRYAPRLCPVCTGRASLVPAA